MALNHTHKLYDNFVLANEIEDQFNSMLDLNRFCTPDNSLVGVAGDLVKVHVYSATDGTEVLAMGAGNTKNIQVTYTESEYRIKLLQNRFPYYDEEVMKDPLGIQVGVRHAAVDMYNTVQSEIYAEFKKATQTVTGALNFNTFVDAAALLNVENVEGLELFAFVSPSDMAAIRKNLKDDLKYVEAFVRSGYVGTVAGINLYTKKDATKGEVYGGTRQAVTVFTKRNTEVEMERTDANTRLTTMYSRKYYLPAMTDLTKAFKITTTTPTPGGGGDDAGG